MCSATAAKSTLARVGDFETVHAWWAKALETRVWAAQEKRVFQPSLISQVAAISTNGEHIAILARN